VLGDDLNSLKVASPILNKCFQGHGGRRFVGGTTHSWRGTCRHGPIAGYGPVCSTCADSIITKQVNTNSLTQTLVHLLIFKRLDSPKFNAYWIIKALGTSRSRGDKARGGLTKSKRTYSKEEVIYDRQQSVPNSKAGSNGRNSSMHPHRRQPIRVKSRRTVKERK